MFGEDGIGRIERKANRVGEMRTFEQVEGAEKVVGEGYIGQKKECSGGG